MNTTTEPSEITTTNAQRRRCHAIGMIVGGAAAVALFAFLGTTWPGAPETTVASGTVQLMDSASSAPLRVQDVDDDDSGQDEAQLQQQNNAMQMMIQSEQQAEEQNEQAQQQALQDELQAQQTEQQADQ
jgi:preprotein translocase subunit SecF